MQEHLQPMLDVFQLVRASRVLGHALGPRALLHIFPCMPREERDLRGPQSKARDVVKIEILQLIRTDLRFRAL